MHGNRGPSGIPSQTDQAKAKLSMTAKQAPETTHHPTEVLQEQGTWLQSHRALGQETSHRAVPIQEKQTPEFRQKEKAGLNNTLRPDNLHSGFQNHLSLSHPQQVPQGQKENPESEGGTLGRLLCTEHRLGARPSTSPQASSHAKAGLCPLSTVRIVRKCLACPPSP